MDVRCRRRLWQAAQIHVTELETRLLYCGGNFDDGHHDNMGDFPSMAVSQHQRHLNHLAHLQHPNQLVNGWSLTGGATGLVGATYPLSNLPQLNSNPNAAANLFLDFNGQAAMTWGGYNVPTTPAYDTDGNATSFSDTELAAIQQIWQRVAEAYAPFNINVTTVDPGNRTDLQTVSVVIGGSGSWLGAAAGGVSYVGSFYNSAPNVAWVFPAQLANGYAKYVADATEHEAGHSFGLQHQSAYSGSSKTAEYRGGDGFVAPIMGNSYSAARSKWSNGQSSLGYSVLQDDMAVLAGNNNGFGYRADDHGDTIGTADMLDVSGDTVSGSGVITRTSDVDVFSFYTEAGPVSFTVSGPQYGALLDATLTLVDLNGNVIVTANTTSLSETVSTTLSAGSYRLIVSSKGNYGDVGQYTISGTIVPSPDYCAAPSNLTVNSGAGGVTLNWYDNAWNENGYVVQRSTTGGGWTDLATLDPNTHTYLDETAVVGLTYQYRVYAFNDTMNSSNSNAANIAVTPPTPTGLSATSVSSTRIDLSWTDVEGESGYVIERSTNGTTWSTLTTVNSDVSSYSDTGVVAGTRYYYRIRANSAAGASANTASVYAVTRTATPTLTATTNSSSQITLTWTNVTGETGYRVERSTNGNDWSTLGTTGVDRFSYICTALSGGTTYYFRVVAVNAGGDSAAGTATGTTQLAAPTGLTVTGTTTTQVNLSWTDGNGETGYRIERSLDERTWVFVADVNADVSSYSNTGLNAGTRYLYRVRALNAAGPSAASLSVSTYTVPLAPVLTGSSTAATIASLSWTNVAGETNYVLQRSDNGGTDWVTVASPLANVVSYLNTGLTADTDYAYRVVAHNAAGDSAASNTLTVHTLLPNVTGVTATATTNQIDLSWTDSTGETGYRIERSLNGTTWVLLNTNNADATTYSDTGLVAGTTYYYRVRAVNAGGYSNVEANKVVTTIPLSTTLSVSAASATSMKLSWLNVLGETGYRVERSDDGQSGWTTVATLAANVISYVHTGLTANTGYYYRVTPFNASGDAASSSVVGGRTLMSAPTGLTATATSTSQINLSWNDSDGETAYVVERSLNGLTWSALATVNADVTTYSNTALVAGTAYQYRVRAVNAGGNSEAGMKAVATTIPPAVTLNATSTSSTSINLTWTNVAGETGYRVEMSTNGTDFSTLVTTAANVAGYLKTGLTANTLYYFRVTPFNAAGDAASTTISKRTIMGAPTGVSVQGLSATSVQVTWADMSGETGYKVERLSGTTWVLVGTVGADVTSFTNGGLLAGRTYYYRVKALNDGGTSAPSLAQSGATSFSSRIARGAKPGVFQSKRTINSVLTA